MQFFYIESEKFNNLILRNVFDLNPELIMDLILNGPKTDQENLLHVEVVTSRYCNKEEQIEDDTVIFLSEMADWGIRIIVPIPESISHFPNQLGEWIEYNPPFFRYKMNYDIILKDGRKLYSFYPNGNSFMKDIVVKDWEVESIRISEDQYGFEVGKKENDELLGMRINQNFDTFIKELIK